MAKELGHPLFVHISNISPCINPVIIFVNIDSKAKVLRFVIKETKKERQNKVNKDFTLTKSENIT